MWLCKTSVWPWKATCRLVTSIEFASKTTSHCFKSHTLSGNDEMSDNPLISEQLKITGLRTNLPPEAPPSQYLSQKAD
jgi:hypothetical protein